MTPAASRRRHWQSGACSCSSAHGPPPGGWQASSLKTTADSCLPAPASRKRSSTTPAGCRCSWKPAGPGSSPSGTSAAGRSSGPRPQSGKARWRCGWCSNASRPQGAQLPIRPAPTELGAEPTPAEATPAGSRQRVHPRLPRDSLGAAIMTSGAVTADGRACVLADGSQMPMLGLGVWQVPQRAGVRERRTLGARPGVSPYRHSPGLRQRGERREGAARQRHAETRCLSPPSSTRGAGRGPGSPGRKTSGYG